MKNRALNPFVWLGLFLLVVGLACGAAASTPTPVPPTSVPPSPTAIPPTDTPVPTEVPPTEVPPTATPVPTEVPPTEAPATEAPPPTDQPVDEAPAYYIEEFDGSSSSYFLSDYYYFIPSGPDDAVDESIELNDGYLSFNIATEQTYIYWYYSPWYYTDIRIGMEAENIGKNSQYVSLFCRYDPDRGWIEFNVAGDGTYSIYAFDVSDNDYHLINNGGSTAIKIGKQTNEYIAECIGDEIALYVNGQEVIIMTIPNAYRFLDEGYAGFSVGSASSTPVIVDVNWFGIEEP